MRRALIVGAKGQDGRLLHQRLDNQGVAVTGWGRGDVELTVLRKVEIALGEASPDEIYYLAAHHHSSQDQHRSSEVSLYEHSHQTHVQGLVHVLEVMRQSFPDCRLFYAGSSLIFGHPPTEQQDETTPFNPRCIYGITKMTGIQCCRFYRSRYGLFITSGILYNHESALRSANFVIPKIIKGALEISHGRKAKLQLGDLSARVDWGYAPDYVEGMIRILGHPDARDFVIATGVTHSVQETVEAVFGLLQLDWRKHVEETPAILTRRRITLCGDSKCLREATGWQPSVTFIEMLKLLVEAYQNA